MELKQRDKERVIKLIQEARFLALCDRPSEELFTKGVKLKLSPEDQAIADQLTDDDITPENEWLDRQEFITAEEIQRIWEEAQKEAEKTADEWFQYESLDDDILFRSN